MQSLVPKLTGIEFQPRIKHGFLTHRRTVDERVDPQITLIGTDS
jgi:hypothetical protein